MTRSSSISVGQRRQYFLWGFFCVGVMALGVLAFKSSSKPEAALPEEPVQAPSPADGLLLARAQLVAGLFEDAQDTAQQTLATDPQNCAALLISAEAATRLGQLDQALAIYARVPADHPPEFLTAQIASAEIERVAGSIDAAIQLYQRILEQAPEQPLAIERLASLYSMTGFTTEAEPLLRQLVQQGTCRVEQLQWLADPERSILVLEYLEDSLKRRPIQMAPHLGIARIWQGRGDSGLALSHLKQAQEHSPTPHPEIEAAYGRVLLDLGRNEEWNRWRGRQTPQVLTHPQAWLQQGIIAEQLGQKAAACRCFLEALARSPGQREAVYRAARLLVDLGQPEPAAPLLARSALLGEVAAMAGGINAEAPAGEACRRMSEALLALHRDAEALAWAAFAVRATPANRPWFEEIQSTVNSRLASAGANPQADFLTATTRLKATFPLPDFGTLGGPPRPSGTTETGSAISFIDEAQRVGIDFTFMESPDLQSEGRRMFEMTGGGVAVLDYDQDGWPDLYFTQGAPVNAGRVSGSLLDQFYRNRGGQSFANVTDGARIIEASYSQGVTAGDFNNDGFSDIYVANLGANRLFENLGDGTFIEVVLPDDSQWTTSCAMADLNQDSIPDLYDVNYVQGAGLWDKICPTPHGPRICTPYAFDAAPDRLCLGNGDGTFRDVTLTAEISPPCGKGLGVLIGPFDETRRLGIFVANDTAANSLFTNENSPGQPPRFRDTATLAGVAFGDGGQPQACMGVAAADFDGNGLLDLHVTNYANESNALYLSSSGDVFEDHSRDIGLRAASLSMLGFGTQAIDADLDGDMDLVVANGDIDDFSPEGRTFRMRPQVYLNAGGKLTEVISSDPADYFSTASAHRGRGLARLDWNGDGREDFVVSHLDEPVSLVTNRTVTANRTISIRLIGTVSSRDAIGAVVMMKGVSPTDQQRLAFVTAGDGYQAKNESKVRFAVPANMQTIELSIDWPSGTQSIHQMPALSTSINVVEPSVLNAKP